MSDIGAREIGRVEVDASLPPQSIGKLATSLYYVHEDTPIEHLFNLFQDEEKKITAVAVVDDNLYGKGTIVRKELASLLSKPFGREVLRKRPVSRVITPTKSFLNTQHLFIVSDELDAEVKSGEEHYFLLIDKTGRFKGIFSTQDILIYLSNLTQNDITLAHSLQTRMVKERLAVLTADLEIVGSSHTAKGVGGDFYSAKKITNTRWILSLCDVSGKGVAASIVTAMLYGILESYDFRYGLVEFVRKLNHSIFSTFNAEKYLTGIFMLFDEETARLKILDMGHSFISLIRDGRLHKINTSADNLPVGITPHIDPQMGVITLQRRDIVVLVTDGLSEQKNNQGIEYSMNRMHRIILAHQEDSLEEIREHVLEDFHTFKQDAPYHDDVTFMLIRYPDEEEFDADFEWEKEEP